ncbi:MAG: hypothetical protein RSA49_00105 [Anaerovoracaceae bacterium]
MMIHSTGRLAELEKEFFAETDRKKREAMLPELRKLWAEQDEEYKDCPFAH